MQTKTKQLQCTCQINCVVSFDALVVKVCGIFLINYFMAMRGREGPKIKKGASPYRLYD